MSEQDTPALPTEPIIVPLSKAQRARFAHINAEIARWTQTRDEVATAIVAGAYDPDALNAAGWKLFFSDMAIVVKPPAAPPSAPADAPGSPPGAATA